MFDKGNNQGQEGFDMSCHHICTRDRDTGELFCPRFHKWVERCPYEDYEAESTDDEADEDDE